MVTRKMLAKAVGVLNQATLVTDLEMNVVFMNPLARKLLGCSKEKSSEAGTVPLNLTITGTNGPEMFEGKLETQGAGETNVEVSVTPLATGTRITGYLFRFASQGASVCNPALLN